MKSVEEAERVADELKEMIEKGLNKKLIRYYYSLVGWIELKRQNFNRAIEHLKESLSLSLAGDDGQAWNRHSLGQAYFESGDLEKSQEAYEGIISLPESLLKWPEIYIISFYMLGKIYEQIGWKGKAIEHYEKFLSLWKDADPGIAEVDDARERLAGLTTNQ